MGNLDFKIPHKHWNTTMETAFAYLTIAQPGELVCIVGPSRAGKTKIAENLINRLQNDNPSNKNGCMPVISVDASNAGVHGSFSTKEFTLRMLEEIKHPFFSNEDIFEISTRAQRVTESTLRIALEQGMKARKTRYLFIDEAQHVRYASKGAQAPYAVMDSWKCLAKATNTVLVVIGAYPILDTLAHSPHLLGRKHQIHFPRYRRTSEELKLFAQVVKAFENHLVISESLGSLINAMDLLYYGSLGCVGLLRAWLERAAVMSRIGNKLIDRSILTDTILSDSDLTEIRREIVTGERFLQSGPLSNITEEMSSETIEEAPSPKEKNKAATKHKPYTRKPKRMAIGHRDGG